MKIIVDENIPFGVEAFSGLGEVRTMPGRSISNADLRNAEILIVRSITPVNAKLLKGTPVRFVGTATIGLDHLDREYLKEAGIEYCGAPGCNANSVADYVTAALLDTAKRQGQRLEGKKIGVVGCGNVGSRVVKRARALGMVVVENDPPLKRQTGDARYQSLDDLLDSDYLTLHTPLTKEGSDATHHLVDRVFLNKINPKAVLLNTSRGAVIDCKALKQKLKKAEISGAVLDVWEEEPCIDPELVDLTLIATPHIAGYSLEGKVNGTTHIYRQVCKWLGKNPDWDVKSLLPANPYSEIDIDSDGRQDEEVLREVVFKVYPIQQQDDESLRATIENMGAEKIGKAFDTLRKNYPCRREFSLTTVKIKNGSENLKKKLQELTFKVAE